MTKPTAYQFAVSAAIQARHQVILFPLCRSQLTGRILQVVSLQLPECSFYTVFAYKFSKDVNR